MVVKYGNMWEDSRADLLLFTGNATVRRDGALVMGRGAALQAQVKFLNCNRAFGSLINHYYKDHMAGTPYGLLIHPDMNRPKLGCFQVKRHYAEPADLDIIYHSTSMLLALAEQYQLRKLSIALNFPGIGYSRLQESDVIEIISCLPDNVEVWKYK
jgi:hypothetical protein